MGFRTWMTAAVAAAVMTGSMPAYADNIILPPGVFGYVNPYIEDFGGGRSPDHGSITASVTWLADESAIQITVLGKGGASPDGSFGVASINAWVTSSAIVTLNGPPDVPGQISLTIPFLIDVRVTSEIRKGSGSITGDIQSDAAALGVGLNLTLTSQVGLIDEYQIGAPGYKDGIGFSYIGTSLYFNAYAGPGEDIDFTVTAYTPRVRLPASAVAAGYSLELSPGLIAAVPEPATWAMMLIGFAGLGITKRRRDMALAANRLSQG